MLAITKSFGLDGVTGYPIDVEVDINNGLPTLDIVGLAGTAIKESKERVRSAIKNSGYLFPTKKITINLAPADTKKDTPIYDLAIALGIMQSAGIIKTGASKEYILVGELSLDGSLRHVKGVLPLIISAVQQGYKKFIVPKENGKEASFVEGIEVYAMDNLRDVCALLSGEPFKKVAYSHFENKRFENKNLFDFKDVKGQVVAKRALEIAVSGGHNAIMVGPPGSGKTMLAKCVPSIMPDMTFDEAIEVTKLHSIAGILDNNEGIVGVRPFRSPHHTATIPALVGGGAYSKPGEVSLAHNGVLFLDETPEYKRQALETLRQPLEDKMITIARAQRTVTYPANFMLICSMNPCPCGNYGSKTNECKCTPQQIRNYHAKLSGPLMDRIDLHIDVDSVSYGEFRSEVEEEPSKTIKERVDKVRKIQLERFKNDGIFTNSDMSNALIKKYCKIDDKCEKMLEQAFKMLNLSARATNRILKVARTIADMDGAINIEQKHLAEAIQYRSLDKKYFD